MDPERWQHIQRISEAALRQDTAERAAFGFRVAAMLVPLVSEFDVALGRTSGGAD